MKMWKVNIFHQMTTLRMMVCYFKVLMEYKFSNFELYTYCKLLFYQNNPQEKES